MISKLSDISLRDLEVFIMAARSQSLREVARQLNLLPAHTSKIIKGLEHKLDIQLFKRSVNGIILTPEAMSILPTVEKICEMVFELSPGPNRQVSSIEKLWTLGSIGFLSTYLVSPVVSQISEVAKKPVRFRLIEFTHNDLVAHGLKGAFDLAVHIQKLEWTHIWQSYSIGTLKWKLYGSYNHSLAKTSTESQVSAYPFIVPTDWSLNSYTIGEDFCPLSVRRRKKGNEAATAETALEICRHSDQLTFVPEILAQNWCQNKQMKEIKVSDWPVSEKEIFLSVKSDVVSQQLVDIVMNGLKKQPALSSF